MTFVDLKISPDPESLRRTERFLVLHCGECASIIPTVAIGSTEDARITDGRFLTISSYSRNGALGLRFGLPFGSPESNTIIETLPGYRENM